MGALIAFLIKYLPTILALLSSLFGGGAALSYHASWQAQSAAAMAGGFAAPDPSVWWQYVGGSIAAAITGAISFWSAQARQSRAHDALGREESAQAAMLAAIQLRAQFAAMPLDQQSLIIGK